MAKSKAEFRGAEAADVATPVYPDVLCRVSKRGDGKVSTGVHTSRGGDELYEQDDEFRVAKDIADGLEDLGYVAIIPDAKAKAA